MIGDGAHLLRNALDLLKLHNSWDFFQQNSYHKESYKNQQCLRWVQLENIILAISCSIVDKVNS